MSPAFDEDMTTISRTIVHDHDACGLGLVTRLCHPPSRAVVRQALSALTALTHRGAVGADDISGDGAGILLEIPHDFFAARLPLPASGRYAVGVFFFQGESYEADGLLDRLQATAARHHFRFLVRPVPVNSGVLGPIAGASEPRIYHLFFISGEESRLSEASLHRLRLDLNREAKAFTEQSAFVISLSRHSVVYKAMVRPQDLAVYYPDLSDAAFQSRYALVHTRFSTNTLPNWRLIQPFSRIAHNGEFNTLKGNLSWFMADIAAAQRSGSYGYTYADNCPDNSSDSCLFDHVLDWHVGNGVNASRALRRMIPPAWEGCEATDRFSPEERNFFAAEGVSAEPWDGPALVGFADAQKVGAILDRSGLRPARFTLQSDGWFYLASECGAFPSDPALVIRQGRLQPGDMLTVDPQSGEILLGAELNKLIASESSSHVAISSAKSAVVTPRSLPWTADDWDSRNRRAGVFEEEVETVLTPMAETGYEPLASMGNDLPLAVLSDEPRSLFAYCHQKFAQVTNPPLDAIREAVATSLTTTLPVSKGSYLWLSSPFLSEESFEVLRGQGPVTHSVDLTLAADETLEAALRRIGQAAAAFSVLDEDGSAMIVLEQPRSASAPYVSTLLAVSYVHRILTESGRRRAATLAIVADDARDAHALACLIGFGADVVVPRLGCDWARKITGTDGCYLKALEAGLLKIMSKMGIATVQAYRGAQIFDVIGFSADIMSLCFPAQALRVGGTDFLKTEASARSYQDTDPGKKDWQPGLYQWSPEGTPRLHTPNAVGHLQRAVRFSDRDAFANYFCEIDAQSRKTHLRGHLMAKAASHVAHRADDEALRAVLKKFTTGAMSLGSISEEAHETISLAANQLGVRSNSGEGGEAARRNHPDADGRSRKSAIRQVASGRFGVTTSYLVHADELQIKIAQGAKPGEGGQLPGHKVDERIAGLRHTIPGITLISPPPHHDIYSIEDLAQLIFDLKSVNPTARVSVKLVASSGVDVVAVGVAKAGADTIVISGYEGGTGASPLSSIHHAGLPWELALHDCHQLLIRSGLRGRVHLQVDGGIRTPRDVVVATMLGADEFGFGTITLMALGCVMMRQCHTNRCPVGIATQDPVLRELFPGEPQHLVRFFQYLAEGVMELVQGTGAENLSDLRGRLDLLELGLCRAEWRLPEPVANTGADHETEGAALFSIQPRADDHCINDAIELLSEGLPYIYRGTVTNQHRSFGARLAGRLQNYFGEDGLPAAVDLHLEGVAGSSFMAFAVAGMSATLTGSVNDYLGKGLSGGHIYLRSPFSEAVSGEAVLCGNVALYGATSGQVYIAGQAGERFAVRNSGAVAVVEGIGDNGCEYMTGGLVLSLGPVGLNFGAGMSGGVAFVAAGEKPMDARLNAESVASGPCEEFDRHLLRLLLECHFNLTGSMKARKALNGYGQWIKTVQRVISPGYAAHWQQRAMMLAEELSDLKRISNRSTGTAGKSLIARGNADGFSDDRPHEAGRRAAETAY